MGPAMVLLCRLFPTMLPIPCQELGLLGATESTSKISMQISDDCVAQLHSLCGRTQNVGCMIPWYNDRTRYDPTQHRDAGTAFYTKDEAHQIYRLNGIWHIAHSAATVFYRAEGGAAPPLIGWVSSSGANPPPTLKAASGY